MERKIFISIALLFITLGCSDYLDDAEYAKIKELATASKIFEIPTSETSLKVPVYSNGNVSVRFVGENPSWVTLEQSAFAGDDTLRLAFSENEGFRRMAKVQLTLNNGEKTDTLFFKQSGVVPYLQCAAPFTTIDGRSAGAASFDVQSNLEMNQIETSVSYLSGAEGWISSVSLSEGKASVNTSPTGSEHMSKAKITLSYIDSWEEEFSVALFATASDKNGKFGTEITWTEARALAGQGEIQDDSFITGVIISDFRSKNLALNPSVSYNKVDITESDKTAYIQKEDGSMGFCLKFETPEDNVLSKGTAVTLSLQDLTINKELNPERYIITGVKAGNIVQSAPGNIAEKNKMIAELQDDDIYTWVKLQGTEFYCKYGAYSNVNENYTISSSINAMLSSSNKDRMDTWASMLVDTEGSAIYAPVNMSCEWRRSTDTGITTLVPQGNGVTEGIIVSEENPRYGDMGKYQIRVIDQTGFCQEVDGTSAFTEHVRYNGQPYSYRYGQYGAIDQKYAAPVGLINRMKQIIPSDDISQTKKVPNAEFTCQNWSAAAALTDNNYPIASNDAYCSPFCSNAKIGKAGVASTDNSTGHPRAMILVHDIKGWFEWTDNKVTGYHGVVLDVKAKDLSGDVMMLSFAFGAGKNSASTSRNYPAHWCVECSVDGGETFALCPDAATGKDYVHLRSYPWADSNIDGTKYMTAGGAGLGATEHCFRLPSDAFGLEHVFIRIRPYDDTMSVLPLAWNGDVENGKVAYNTKVDTYINFEYISVRYR
ncbi:MAG: BACON domain-containing protein [Bacteroidales bacterium]|nr:BACON domain-containing protein [Bacteroidales bacterium]